jgi:hypothetical protein
MGEVYRHANRVLVCIGKDPDGNAEDVASLVAIISQKTAAYKSILEMPVLKEDDPILDDKRWPAVATMIGQPWFTRAWVLQEVGLAKNAIVLYGVVEFSYQELMAMAIWVTKCAPQLDPRWDFSFSSAHMDWMDWSDDWQEKAAYPNQTLLSLLNQTRCLDCTDLRDRIYAYLGHPLCRTANGLDLIMIPDYDKSPLEVSYELATKLVQADGVKALAPVEHNDKDIYADFPTWVPWCWPEEWVSCSFGVYTGFYYNSSKGLLVDPVIEGRRLNVTGVLVDRIKEVFRFNEADIKFGSPVDLQMSDSETNESRMLKNIWKHLDEQNHQNKDWQTEFAITLTAGLRCYDSVEESTTALEQHIQDFAAYWTIFSKCVLKNDISASLMEHLNISRPSFSNVERFWVDMRLVCEGRSFIVTENGRFGLAPWISKPGDVCCVLFGGRSPFVLRPEVTGDGEVYRLAGECFIQGLMHGEAIDLLNKKELQQETLVII